MNLQGADTICEDEFSQECDHTGLTVPKSEKVGMNSQAADDVICEEKSGQDEVSQEGDSRHTILKKCRDMFLAVNPITTEAGRRLAQATLIHTELLPQKGVKQETGYCYTLKVIEEVTGESEMSVGKGVKKETMRQLSRKVCDNIMSKVSGRTPGAHPPYPVLLAQLDQRVGTIQGDASAGVSAYTCSEEGACRSEGVCESEGCIDSSNHRDSFSNTMSIPESQRKEISSAGVYTKDAHCSYDKVCKESFEKKRYVAVNKPTCEICSKTFTRKETLRAHILVHTRERPYTCDVCSKTFRWKGEFSYHKARHDGSQLHKCEVCSKSFDNKSRLVKHMIYHGNARPHVCVVCSSAFKGKQHLQKHMEKHDDSRPFLCDVCAKGFKRIYQLRKHMRIHSQPIAKPHVCEVCSEAFKTKSSRSRHIKFFHSKPKSLGYAERAMTAQLLRHGFNPSVLRPNNCEFCSKGFKTKSGCRKHIRLFHLKT